MKNYIYKKADDSLKLYEFYRKIAAKIPYWFTVDFEIWSESMFSDTDYEGKRHILEQGALPIFPRGK